MVRLLPDEAFALLLAELQHLAKPLGFLAANGLVGFGLGGVLYAWATPHSRRPRPVLGLADQQRGRRRPDQHREGERTPFKRVV